MKEIFSQILLQTCLYISNDRSVATLRGTMQYRSGTTQYPLFSGYYGYCAQYPWVLQATIELQGTMGSVQYPRVLLQYPRVLRVLRYYRVLRVLYCTHGYYVVPETGYYRVLQAYAAAGMNRVMFRVRLRVCTPHARYLTFLRVILIKMARA